MIFDVHNSHNGPTVGKVVCLDRNQQRQQKLLEQGMLRNRECDDRNMWPERMTEFLTVSHVVQCHDENEIDLDDASESKCQDKGAELLVLGTGCASPSPYRGASGYALIIPCALSRQSSHMNGLSAECFSDLVVAVDVGEGYCTQWNRYGAGRPVACISLVWISHAHWDHYGGLVNLLLQIELDKQQRVGERLSPKRSNERRALIESADQAHILAPWVVAPVKIIKYLTLVLGNSSKYFRSVRIDHPAAMSHALADINERYRKPLVFWENVKVDHSCPTYGCVVGLQREGSASYFFCYSGDTRPCARLVQTCRRLAVQHRADDGRVDFLLHEATFDATEADMSVAKKHSTAPEAVQVGRDVDVRRLLLTHFSQRYHTIPDVALESSRFDGRMKVGFALDGLSIPLFYST
jgi:ribonuclease Z